MCSSPAAALKNFMLQTEPQIQEVLGIDEKGHDFFLQITDARPDTGGLSGATPAEAVSWGKIDPDRLPDAVVCYLDSTVALPLLTAYAHARHAKRPLKRLYDRRGEMMNLYPKGIQTIRRKVIARHPASRRSPLRSGFLGMTRKGPPDDRSSTCRRTALTRFRQN